MVKVEEVKKKYFECRSCLKTPMAHGVRLNKISATDKGGATISLIICQTCSEELIKKLGGMPLIREIV